MAVTIVGSGSITGLSAGGLPTGSVTADSLATNSVDSAELVSGAIDAGHLASGVGGKVLQVVGASETTSGATTSTSWTASLLTKSITPSATTSKIVALVTDPSLYNGGGFILVTLFRDSTNLGNATNGFQYTYGSSNNHSFAISILDAPSTTSSVAYTMYYRQRTSGTVYVGNAGPTSIVLMEIGV
jgi:hypothetical protein